MNKNRNPYVKDRTPKQQWQFERLFNGQGTLTGIKNQIERLRDLDSTLPAERKRLRKVLAELNKLDLTKDKFWSWRRFKTRRGIYTDE